MDMTKISIIIRIILLVILVGIPLGRLVYALVRRLMKSSKVLAQKIDEIKELDKMRNELLQQRARENYTDSDEGAIANVEVSFSGNTPVSEKKVVKELSAEDKQQLEKIKYDALLLKEKGKFDEYEKQLIAGLAIDPDNIECNRLLSDYYFAIGQHKKALSLLKKIIEIDSEDHKAIRQIGEIYLTKGEFQTAELLIEKALAIKASNPKYHISMVEIYYNTDRKKEAIDVLEKVVKLRPTNVRYLLTLADLYEEINDDENAKKYYFRVLEYEPSNERAKEKVGQL